MRRKAATIPAALATFAFLLSLAGCSSLLRDAEDYEVEKWKGRDVSRLVKLYGTPTKVLPDRQGGKIYLYDLSGFEEERTGVSAHFDLDRDHDDAPPPWLDNRKYDPDVIWHEGEDEIRFKREKKWVQRYRRFFIDSEGTIYEATWKGGSWLGYEGHLKGKRAGERFREKWQPSKQP